MDSSLRITLTCFFRLHPSCLLMLFNILIPILYKPNPPKTLIKFHIPSQLLPKCRLHPSFLCSTLSVLWTLSTLLLSSLLTILFLPLQISIFFKTTRIDYLPLIELFQHHSIKYMHTQNFLLYLATPLQIEKLVLSSHEYNISIPSSFISSSCKLSFEKLSDQIHVTLIPSTQHAFVEVQIARDNIGTTSEVFWHPDFLSFLRLRFLCQNDPQIKILRSHSGIIEEVLAFTASITLLQTIPADLNSINSVTLFPFWNLCFPLLLNPSPFIPSKHNLNTFNVSRVNLITLQHESHSTFHTLTKEDLVLKTFSVQSHFIFFPNVTLLYTIFQAPIAINFTCSSLPWTLNGSTT